MSETMAPEAAAVGTQTISYREALTNALRLELRDNPHLLFLGEAIATAGGAVRVTTGLADEFGTDRIIETPVSENIMVGAALGGALAGQSMVVEILSADFLFAAGSEVLNDIAKWRFQHRWKDPINLVLRMPMGTGVSFAGAEHTQCIEGYVHRAAGLTVVNPGSALTAGGLLRASIHYGDPVIFLEHRRLYDTTAPLDEVDLDGSTLTIGRASVVREGSDITVVAWSWMRAVVEAAAASLESEGVDVEIVDPVTIKPMDLDTILASVAKTGRLLVVEESPLTGSVACTIVTAAVRGVELGHGQVDIITMPDAPLPFSAALEGLPIPTATQVREKILELVGS
jgi:acetoin:2,6-dichlorophenolindophenol oxidoreductase subunit beta